MISGLIKNRRRELGISQQKLATEAQVSLATLQNIEAGRGNPSLQTLLAILNRLDLELDVQPRTISWSHLTHLGLPVMDSNESQVFLPRSREQLIQTLQRLGGDRAKMDSRQKQALLSFLWAIRDHYPSVWAELDPSWHRWWQSEGSSNPSIKLRRLALARLGEYL